MSLTAGAYLAHHGRKGQKWGDRNGPPYPLDYDKLSPEERAEAKQKAIDRGDVTEARANSKYFSVKEIDDTILKYNKNKQLSELSAETNKKGKTFTEKYTEGAEKYVKIVDATSGIYNVTAKVTNAFGLTNLPIIGEKRKTAEEKHVEQLKYEADVSKYENDILKNKKDRKELLKKQSKEEKELEDLTRQANLAEQRAKISRADDTIATSAHNRTMNRIQEDVEKNKANLGRQALSINQAKAQREAEKDKEDEIVRQNNLQTERNRSIENAIRSNTSRLEAINDSQIANRTRQDNAAAALTNSERTRRQAAADYVDWIQRNNNAWADSDFHVDPDGNYITLPDGRVIKLK